MPIRVANETMTIINRHAETKTQTALYPNWAPTLELVKILPGPSTTAAMINAGPIERSDSFRVCEVMAIPDLLSQLKRRSTSITNELYRKHRLAGCGESETNVVFADQQFGTNVVSTGSVEKGPIVDQIPVGGYQIALSRQKNCQQTVALDICIESNDYETGDHSK